MSENESGPTKLGPVPMTIEQWLESTLSVLERVVATSNNNLIATNFSITQIRNFSERFRVLEASIKHRLHDLREDILKAIEARDARAQIDAAIEAGMSAPQGEVVDIEMDIHRRKHLHLTNEYLQPHLPDGDSGRFKTIAPDGTETETIVDKPNTFVAIIRELRKPMPFSAKLLIFLLTAIILLFGGAKIFGGG